MGTNIFFGILAIIFGTLSGVVHFFDYYNPHLECRFNADELRKKHPEWDIQKKNKEWRELVNTRKARKMYNEWLGIPYYK